MNTRVNSLKHMLEKRRDSMSVEKTNELLEKLVDMSRQSLEKSPINFLLGWIYDQLHSYFPGVSREELHYELLCQGMFEVKELVDLDETLTLLSEKKVWSIVQEEYEKLRILWSGEEVAIFIFPLTKYRPIIDGIEAYKNGVSYKDVIFLFVSPELEKMEIKAMVAHEYHHCCRLKWLNKATEVIPLKESLVLEGMAECMVEDLYGRKWCSPWISRYSQEKLLKIWDKTFVPVLEKKGVDNHQPFLYGDGTARLPNWIGYCLGYRIVRSFLEKNRHVDHQLLIKKSSEEIVAGSDFS